MNLRLGLSLPLSHRTFPHLTVLCTEDGSMFQANIFLFWADQLLSCFCVLLYLAVQALQEDISLVLFSKHKHQIILNVSLYSFVGVT
jgi:hypothetical protein